MEVGLHLSLQRPELAYQCQMYTEKELTNAHARPDAKWQTSKWVDFPQVFIQPTFRYKLQRELKQLLGTSC